MDPPVLPLPAPPPRSGLANTNDNDTQIIVKPYPIKQNKAMENFKDMVMRMAADSQQTPLTAAQISRIDNVLAEKSHILTHIPNHPPYAAMIHRAIQELNEERGSNEEFISNFIRKEYPDLPWAHSMYLKHHLHKLCDVNEIRMSSEGCYLLVNEINRLSPAQSTLASSKRKIFKKQRKNHGRPQKTDVFAIQKQSKEEISTTAMDIAVREEQNEVTEEHKQKIEEWHDSFEEVKLLEQEKCEVTVGQNQVERKRRRNNVRNQAKLKDEAVESGPHEQDNAIEGQGKEKPHHRPIRVKQISKHESTRRTTISECLPLKAVDEDEQVQECSGLGSSSETVVNNVKRRQGRQLKPVDQHCQNEHSPTGQGRGRPPNKKPETASTTALILGLVQHKPEKQERLKYQGWGRPPKSKSSGDGNVENWHNQQQPKRRGRPRKLVLGTQGQ